MLIIESLGTLLSCGSKTPINGFTLKYSFLSSISISRRDPKLLFDMGPQISSSFIILGMSIERYVMVCYASRAKLILKRSRRITFYFIMMTLMNLCWGLLALDFFEQSFFSDRLPNHSVKTLSFIILAIWLWPHWWLHFQSVQRFCDLYNPVKLIYRYDGVLLRNRAYICTRRVIRTISLSFFSVVLFTTGLFYAKTVFALKRGRGDNSNKKTLTIAFICLWALWFIQSTPYVIYDLYEAWSVKINWSHTEGLSPLMAHQLITISVSWCQVCVRLFKVSTWKLTFWLKAKLNI